MKRDEYEERKRRIQEQHRAGVELLEAACRQQIRALELVWMTTAEGEFALLPLPAEPLASPPNSTTTLPSTAVAPAPVEGKPAPERPRRRPAWQLLGDVEAALQSVAEVFDRNDICEALGYEPDRGSLYRILQQLAGEGVLALEDRGVGKHPSRYRKLGGIVQETGT